MTITEFQFKNNQQEQNYLIQKFSDFVNSQHKIIHIMLSLFTLLTLHN